MAAARGYLCVLKIGTDTLGICQDVEPDLTSTEQDITIRANKGFFGVQPGLRSLSMSPKMLWVPSNAAYKALEAAFFNQLTVSFLVLDENGVGWQGDCHVFNIKRGENIGDAVTATVTIKSTDRFFPYSGSTTPPN